jgi:hypothetical protein
VATIREIIAYTEITDQPVCLLSLDFKEAFHRISHSYIYTVLAHYGFSNRLIQRIQHIYDDASSVMKINGTTTRPIPIRSSVRQECPLSTEIFALLINPLPQVFERELRGVKILRNGSATKLVAFADDITVILTRQEDIYIVRRIISAYEQASGARVNVHKSKALALGTWDTALPIMDLPYCEQLNLLGVQRLNDVGPCFRQHFERRHK